MALRGNLKDFSLPDVFQLVQLSGKTGVLRIQGPEAEGSIWFRDGDVFFAQSNWRREQLGERLVNAQRITPAALARALELRTSEPEGGRRLGEILVNEGYITQQVLETFVQEQIQDTIFDLMRWDEGDFDFEVLPEVVHEDIGLAVSVENIVMEGSRRLEEWQRIKKKVPSTEMVFKMATAPGEGTFEISLKPIEWALLLLIDGTRSVRELAIETRSTDFDVARVVYGLFSAGLLEVPADDEIERLRADRARRQDKRAALEAQRAERDAEQQAEALGLEAQLAAEAESRRAAVAVETEAVEAAVEVAADQEAAASATAVIDEPRHAPEEPEFLAVAAEPPSSDDMAVFEQMMASVLAPPSPTVAGETPESGLAPALEVPEVTEVAETPVSIEDFVQAEETEEPLGMAFVPGLDFMPEVEPAADVALSGAIVAPFDELAQGEPETPFVAFDAGIGLEPTPETAGVTLPTEDEFAFGAISQADLESIPAPPVAEEPQAGGFEPSGDFEHDLMSLGLGEYPEELLAVDTPIEARLPMSEMDQATVEPSLVEEAMASEPLFIAEAPEESDPSADVPGADADLDTLLASLGSSEAIEGVISSGTDYGPEGDTTDGYISTDAFLAEFDAGVGLTSGMGDELTALTGGSTTRNRPQATVAKLPEAGETPMLHRDQMVDRSLLEKIIEGIENL